MLPKGLWVVCLAAVRLSAAIHYTYSAAASAPPVRLETVSHCVPGSTEFTISPGELFPVSLTRVATDAGGNTYAVGTRVLNVQPVVADGNHAFLAKVDRAGCLQFTVTIPNALVAAVAVDPAGIIHLAGAAGSDFPIRNSVPNSKGAGFHLRLSPGGDTLLSSTRIDGSVGAILLAPNGEILLGGATTSRDFPDRLGVSTSAPNPSGAGTRYAAFFLKLNASADRILTSGYLAAGGAACGGGSGCSLASHGASVSGLGLDRDQNIYIAGHADNFGLPTTTGTFHGPGIGGFVAKISPDGTKLLYSSYMGSSQRPSNPSTNEFTFVSGLAVDSDGNAIVIGWTRDDKFPATPGSLQPAYSGYVSGSSLLAGASDNMDAFVAKVNPSGTALLWATFLGDKVSSETPRSVSVDGAGNIWLAGSSTQDRGRSTTSHVFAIDGQGSRLLFAATYGANWVSSAQVDSGELLHLAGGAGLITTVQPALSLTPRILSLTGSYGALSGSAVPGAIVTLLGPNIGPADPLEWTPDPDGRVPTVLANTRVYFDDLPAPLLYVSPHQINAIVPNGIRSTHSISVRTSNTVVPFTASNPSSDPRLLSPRAWNQDGTETNSLAPATPGAILSIWLTGTGADTPEGVIATAPRDNRCCQVRLFRTNEPLEVQYAGDAPGFLTAIQQVNFRAPKESGQVEIVTPGGQTIGPFIVVTPPSALQPQADHILLPVLKH